MMHILKPREKSDLFHRLEVLNKRTTLSDEDKQRLYNLEKGFSGEELFDSYVKKYLKKEVITLNDLLLTHRGSTVQLDSLMLTAEGVMVYEIKNYQGNYQMESGRMTTMDGREITDPMSQLNRSLVKLRQLFDDWGINERIEGKVVFMEPGFYLYNVKPTESIVFPPQLESYLQESGKKMNRLSKSHHHLAERLLNAHQSEGAFERKLPVYDYTVLKKGVTCSACGTFDLKLSQRLCCCSKCQTKLSVEETLLKNISDLQFL